MAIKSLSIRIDEELLHKLHIVADYEGRSANSEILILIRNAVAEYAGATATARMSAPAGTTRAANGDSERTNDKTSRRGITSAGCFRDSAS